MLLLVALLASAPAGGDRERSAAANSAAVDHIGLHVADPSRSAVFYQRTLGFRPLPVNVPANMRWLGSGTFQLHLIGGRKNPVDRKTDTHFAFRVNDLAKEIATLNRERIPWTDSEGAPRKIKHRFDGVKQIYFFDPDGYSIEVNQAPKR